jgi:hypothetical protein
MPLLGRYAAGELALGLDLDVYELGICLACLSFVSFPLADGDEREVKRAIREFAPILWEEGLAEPVRAALERAGERGVSGAEEAILEVEHLGPTGHVVAAIVRRLAGDLNLAGDRLALLDRRRHALRAPELERDESDEHPAHQRGEDDRSSVGRDDGERQQRESCRDPRRHGPRREPAHRSLSPAPP